jgi:hypothetical protein
MTHFLDWTFRRRCRPFASSTCRRQSARAIGFIRSDPTPVSHRIGTRLARTAATVISLGRTLDGAFGGRLLNIDALQGGSCGKFPVERFVQIDDHHDASLDRDSKQRDVANPDCNTEVIAKVPLKKKASLVRPVAERMAPRLAVERRKGSATGNIVTEASLPRRWMNEGVSRH